MREAHDRGGRGSGDRGYSIKEQNR
jgi:hypothetical protein